MNEEKMLLFFHICQFCEIVGKVPSQEHPSKLKAALQSQLFKAENIDFVFLSD